MRGWLRDWYAIDYQVMPMTDTMAMSDEMTPEAAAAPHAGHSMPGMATMEATVEMTMPTDPAMMMGMMAGLNRLIGIDYEIAWLESMIDHHDDALHMASWLLDRVPLQVGHAELRALAEQIIADQTVEIEMMENE